MTLYHDALFLPAASRKFWKIQAGIYTASGKAIAQSQCWHAPGSPASAPPPLPEGVTPDILPGRSLFLGAYSNHFGHRLVESTARFHGFAEGPFDQLLIFTQPGQKQGLARRQMQALFELFGAGKPKLVFPAALTRLEEVEIPDQGWGSGALASGSPAFRAFAAAHFAKDIAAEGPEKLYISRSRHNADRGSLICETALEALFAAAGFEIFHPQEHSLAVQIARYRAARIIAGPDGTPFHLLALAARAETRILVLQRRITDDARHLTDQLQAFGIAGAEMIACKPLGWAFAGSRFAHRSLWGEADVPAICQALERLGALPRGTAPWQQPPAASREAELQALMAAAGQSLCEVISPETRLGEVPLTGPDGRPQLIRLSAG